MVDISIIIPTYNREKCLQKTLLSCFTQKGVSVEIIVIDDGGSDDTKTLVESLPYDVRYQWQEKAGPAKARNVGMSMATGRYIKFLDSDDILEENSLAFTYAIMEATNADVGYGQWQYCDQNDTSYGEVHGKEEGNFLLFLLTGDWYPNFAFIFRASSVRAQCITWDESVFYVADFSFILAVAAKIKEFVYMPRHTGYYRKHHQHHSLSGVGNERNLSYVNILQKQHGIANTCQAIQAHHHSLLTIRTKLLTMLYQGKVYSVETSV